MKRVEGFLGSGSVSTGEEDNEGLIGAFFDEALNDRIANATKIT